MKTARVSIFGIPAHPVVNDWPATLFQMASVCDVVAMVSGKRSWAQTGYHMLALGNITAVMAGALGALDFLRLPKDPEVQRTGRMHAAMNGVLLPLMIMTQLQRRKEQDSPSSVNMAMMLVGNVGLAVSAWYGSKLLYRHGVRAGETDTSPMAPVQVKLEPARALQRDGEGASGGASGQDGEARLESTEGQLAQPRVA